MQRVLDLRGGLAQSKSPFFCPFFGVCRALLAPLPLMTVWRMLAASPPMPTRQAHPATCDGCNIT